MKNSTENNAIEQYECEQKLYWDQLRQELHRYKHELGATNIELAEGLTISRQPLVSFMQESRSDLPIQRVHLMCLWYSLTSPECVQKKRLATKCQHARQMLQKAGPDRLLQLAGYLPKGEQLKLAINPERYQQIQRIASGLSMIPVQDDTDFIDLVDFLEREFISRTFAIKNMIKIPPKEVLSSQYLSEENIDYWVNKWIKNNIYMELKPSVESRFRRAIYKFIRQGRHTLTSREIFELYLSILENEKIYRKIENSFKIRVSQCQFADLTFSIFELDDSGDKAFRDKLMQLFLHAESRLRFADSDDDSQGSYSAERQRYLKGVVADVVTEASVTCIFQSYRNKQKYSERICWNYASSATHFENMFTAIYQGMGCEEELELVDFSTITIGRRVDSLVKASTTLKEHEQERLHQGIWVDKSTVVSVAQSVVVALKSWLTAKLPNGDAYTLYYDACTDMAAITHCLHHGCKSLSEYVLQPQEEERADPARDYLLKNVVRPVERLRQDVLASTPILQAWYSANLERKNCLSQISCARSCHVEGDLKRAAEFLEQAQETLQLPGVNEDVALDLRLEQEQLLQKFYSGDHTFIANRHWRESFPSHLKLLRDYIFESDSSGTQRRYRGRLDANVYLCVSEIYARAGRLEFVFATREEEAHLVQSADHLLIAAYYASKVGERKRTAHWLANASRVYCRLGDGGMANKLIGMTDQLLCQSIDQRYSDQYKDAIMAEVHISRGEKALLIDQDPQEAIYYFGRSFQGAAYLGFVRLLADSLYNIARAAETLEQPVNLGNWLGCYGVSQKRTGNHFVTEAIDAISSLDSNMMLADTAPFFKQAAQKIWHDWTVTSSGNPDAKHPLEEAIEKGEYLQLVG